MDKSQQTETQAEIQEQAVQPVEPPVATPEVVEDWDKSIEAIPAPPSSAPQKSQRRRSEWFDIVGLAMILLFLGYVFWLCAGLASRGHH